MIAVITYGWETESYYQKWFGGGDTQYSRMAVKEMIGLGLNPASLQSKFAPAALELVRDILQDKNYVARIKRHYKMFKETVDGHPVRMAVPDKNLLSPNCPTFPLTMFHTEYL